MGSSFSAKVVPVAGRALITCEGELDMDSADRLRRAVDDALAAEPVALHIDCAEVTFIDSIGLRALIHTDELCRARGIPLMIIASDPVRRIIEMVGAALEISAPS